MIEIDEVAFCYPGKKRWLGKTEDQKMILKELSLKVESGELFGIVGPNGCGKTTLLKLIIGALHPTQGTITVDGGVKPNLNLRSWRVNIGFVSGAVTKLFASLDLSEHVALYSNLYPNFDRDWLNERFEEFQLVGKLQRRTSTLSFGERIKFECALTLACQPKFIFLDEPTVGLDVVAIDAVRKMVSKYMKTHGASGLLTSHNLHDIAELCERGGFVTEGRIENYFTRNETSAQQLEMQYRRIYS